MLGPEATPPAARVLQGPKKRVAIVQSNYIPWKGYFDLIARADEFILYDDAQYTKRDWRNRNQIKTADGVQWLTIPVLVKGRFTQSIKDTLVSDPKWACEHWKAITFAYSRTPCFKDFAPQLEEFYRSSPSQHLSEINRSLVELVCGMLGIRTKISTSMDYGVYGNDPSEKLLNLCRKAGADRYLSGPAAQDYLDVGLFQSQGIGVEFFDYSGYAEYRQLYPPFTHSVSIIDLIFNEGPRATDYMKMKSSSPSAS